VRGLCDAATGRGRVLAAMLAVVCMALLIIAAPVQGQQSLSVSAECTPRDCPGWHTSPVSISWHIEPSTAVILAGCQPRTFTADNAGTTEFCRARNPQTGVTTTVEQEMKVDLTAPVVTGAAPARGADANGWYNHAVSIAFRGSDQTSKIDFCTSHMYGGPDSATASLAGTCTDLAGNESHPFPYGLKYDETAPLVLGANPERSPNAAGWFNRPVLFNVAGTDATAGIADCPGVTYGGADSATASFIGSCRDQAGNSASRTFGLKYDSTPPPIHGLQTTVGDRRVALQWSTNGDANTLEVARTPGLGEQQTSVVFRGPGDRFLDTKVRNGIRYVYELRIGDAAGNGRSRTVSAVPGFRLVSPTVMKVKRPPLLRWTPVNGARYYNIQLSRGGRKILSVWPTRARYQLKKRWSYGGKDRRLVPGRYRWRVWPGFGPRSKGNYGKQIGPRTFTLVR
jgi:hypothetical protein